MAQLKVWNGAAFVAVDGGLYVPQSLVDAKGDLLVGSAADTVARLAVGANGTIPMADTTQATGIRWSVPHTMYDLGLTH